MERIKQVFLVSLSLNKKQAFSIEHAERLLALKDSGWDILDKDKFEFDKEHGLRVRTNKEYSAKA